MSEIGSPEEIKPQVLASPEEASESTYIYKLKDYVNNFKKVQSDAPDIDLSEEANEMDFLSHKLSNVINKLNAGDSKKEYYNNIGVPQGEKKPKQLPEWVKEITTDSPSSDEPATPIPPEKAFKKIEDKKGTNDGGVYEDEATGERLYAKLYKDMDQARMEYIANQVYEKLGIAVPHTQLTKIEDKPALATKWIPDMKRLSPDELRNNDTVRRGFVADAFLANRDVVGLVYDNIEQSSDGNAYRVDNGGTFTFRAQGGDKPYPADTIEELDTLRDPDINAQSTSVFEGLTDEELKTQAQHLIDNLPEYEIDNIVASASVPRELAETVANGMKGRRQYLIRRFGLTEDEGSVRYRKKKERAEQALESLAKKGGEGEGGKLEKLFAVKSILGDSDKIEGHQIDFISKRDKTAVEFKLTSGMRDKLHNEVIPSLPTEDVSSGNYEFESTEGKEWKVGPAWIVKVSDNTSIYVAQGASKNMFGDKKDIRTLMGAVRIEVKDISNTDEIAAQIELAFAKIQFNEALLQPTPEAERKYKENRFRWQHRLEDDGAYEVYTRQYKEEHGIELDDALERQEVFPEYQTIVEPEASKRYDLGELQIVHDLYTWTSVVAILKHGLISSHERHKRGLLASGMSTDEDFHSGGADNVFLSLSRNHNGNDVRLVFNPKILDRTDWYAYFSDTYGTTAPTTFGLRPSPEAFIDGIKMGGSKNILGNEIMMRRGIPSDMIDSVLVPNMKRMDDILKMLRENGIHEVHGKPIEEFVKISATQTEPTQVKQLEF